MTPIPIFLALNLAPAATPEVRAHWHDGKAELAGYRLTQPRYGQARSGTAVLIYVTEPFSESDRVKAENPGRPAADVFDVFKLNSVKDFQTGVYDYNVMTSVFLQMDARKGQRAGAPTKLTFSMQEWCGMVFEELLFDERAIRQKRFSYFDGEGDTVQALARPEEGVTVDELFVLVRGIPVPFLAPGESRSLPLLPALDRVRMVHKPLTWTDGTLRRSRSTRTRTTPAGRFDVDTYTAEVGADRYRFDVERGFPNRLVGWEGPQGEQAELAGVARLPYWQLNREGHEKILEKLGLRPPQGVAAR